MSIAKNNGDTYITVVPYCPHCSTQHRKGIVIRKLCFWFNNTISHAVDEESILQFLKNVKLFGACVYPDFPELGCFAINGDESFSPAGKTRVGEIHYKGEVIYCRS